MEGTDHKAKPLQLVCNTADAIKFTRPKADTQKGPSSARDSMRYFLSIP